MDKAAELLPPWLRFMRGLVDTGDLPLNVSRELLQNNRTVEKIKSALVKRTLDLLEELAADKPAGICRVLEDLRRGAEGRHHRGCAARRRAIAKLLRFHSTAVVGEARRGHARGLRVAHEADQKAIYYLTADTLAAARNSPHLEGFRARGTEVLLLTDRIDEWVAGHLHEFEGKNARQRRERRGRRRLRHRDPGQGRRRIGLQGDAGAARQGAGGQDRERAASARAPHRFAGRAGRGRVRHQPAHGPDLEAGGPEQSLRDAADSRVEPQASAGRAPEGHGGRSRFRRSRPCAVRPGDARRGRRDSTIRRSSSSASTSSSSRGSRPRRRSS